MTYTDERMLMAETTPETDADWKILIVDDEPEIHILTRTVLKDVRFDDRALLFLSAHNTVQTKKILAEEDDIALILMDVVMETEDAGLELVRYIREDLGNRLTRIILRTGAPGEAPERRVITEYEINDYKEKIDLTSNRLFTSVVKSLRNYRDLKQMRQINDELDRSRQGLSKLIESSAVLFAARSLGQFYTSLMKEAAALLSPISGALLADAAVGVVLYASGKWEGKAGLPCEEVLENPVMKTYEESRRDRPVLFADDHVVCRLDSARDSDYRLVIDGMGGASEGAVRLLEILIGNANIVFSNLSLEEDSQSTQTEMIGLLGDVVENRSQELQGHVHRVSDYAVFLARKAGIPEEDVAVLKDAVPMHDIGKIGIVDSILLKPGKLSPEEFEVMKTHTSIGYEILRFSSRKLFQMAAIIAREHHEQWDGKGYPRGLSGDDIHILGRITCIVDVFDALSSDRVYRKAWKFEETMKYIEDGMGTKFDPKLVDLFLAEPERIKEIMIRYKDQ